MMEVVLILFPLVGQLQFRLLLLVQIYLPLLFVIALEYLEQLLKGLYYQERFQAQLRRHQLKVIV